ncbi:pentatricopeptide repeat-containing protein At1g06143 [Mercurialis annua]|uniref:pentatricopeptide repeat-containing protein At1g06143 n=1 Tax=Mercurialis annua TaxID=3986 RepID=UPI00215EA1EB|nr:pentatricopeptide repeat-containing protein At1g06143 [Mercurialis annua]XP_050204706.1 pentatricopeptide repeat-containing protein At1g06143 [Mercurialis annua]XP_050204708.1 pentatricopeptide repeat-containing protein At1g06143 [Mercurialis annua]XP_055959850.1 pentatricopeptide repeat-containing protein At1g06143 [Mercurialis annua]
MHSLFLCKNKSQNFIHSIRKCYFSISTTNFSLLNHLKNNCSTLKHLDTVYAAMIITKTTQDCFLMNQFITACSTFNHINFAFLAYTHMASPNLFVYNAMTRAFVKCHHPIQALVLYTRMLRAGILPSSYTFSSLIKACSLAFEAEFGLAVHCHVWRLGFVSNAFVQTGLIDFYSSFGRIVESTKVFDEMPERDVFVWTTMVSCLAKAGDMSSAKGLFDLMPEKNTAAWNALIYGYAKLRDVESAEFLFDRMDVRDIISWTTMISCYSQNKRFREALVIFNEMTKAGFCPDEVTMATVFSTCAHLGALGLGMEIHLYAMQNGFDLDVYIGSSLIDMYAKCGSLDRSLLVFFKLREKNLFCWNSVIEGLAAHGYAKEALTMFDKMEMEKNKPNGVTFISVLNACAHAGLVEQGRKRFESMMHDYSIPPAIEHYGCMVDLLSKAGLLEEALELIRNMNFQPNSVIWGALLGGCKLHRNLKIAQISVDELMVLEPGNAGHYTLLVNMYAEVNKWDKVTTMRRTIKEQGIEKKQPGSSWIEMEREVHQFAASDKSHPASDEIYSLLTDLDGQLKLAGQITRLWSIL